MFNIGDIVEVVEGARYRITGPGSWGIVVISNEYETTVRFKEVMNGPYSNEGGGGIFGINPIDLVSRDKNQEKLSPVVRKIRSMEQRRKSMGYQW